MLLREGGTARGSCCVLSHKSHSGTVSPMFSMEFNVSHTLPANYIMKYLFQLRSRLILENVTFYFLLTNIKSSANCQTNSLSASHFLPLLKYIHTKVCEVLRSLLKEYHSFYHTPNFINNIILSPLCTTLI